MMEEERLHMLEGNKSPSGTHAREEEDILLETMVLCPVLPRQRLHLHIYEPRYRLMTQRCLEGSRRFGMLARNRGGRTPLEYGTEVEIVECEPLPGKVLFDIFVWNFDLCHMLNWRTFLFISMFSIKM